MRIAKWISSAAVLIALFAFPLLAQYYVPIVEWNGTEFRVMNGSGSYDLQPVDSPVVDVPFSNPNAVAVWSDGTDIHTFVVDSYNDRVQFFDTQLTRGSNTEADFTWTAGAADEGLEWDDNALYIENTLGDVVRGSEKLTVGGVVFSRVSALTGYSSTDNVYTITYEGADVDNSGILAFPANTLSSSSEFVIEWVESSVFNTQFSGELDYQVAAGAVNGTVVGDPFEINEAIPSNPGTALAFENLSAIAHVENQADAAVEDIYVLDAGEIGTVDPHIHAFEVEHDAAATFAWVDTYDGAILGAQDVEIAESGDNVLAVLADGAGFTTWNGAAPPDFVAADESVDILNNALMNDHQYTVTVTDAQDVVGVDLDGITFSITDNTTGNLVGYFASSATVADEVVHWRFLPWLDYTFTLGDGTGPGEDNDVNFALGDDLVINPGQAGATKANINEFFFIADTGNDRIKVLKGFDNHESGQNYTAGATVTNVDPFADDTQRKDYYAVSNANVANQTFVSATRAQESTFTLFTHSSVSGDSVAWTRVDNFAGSTDSDKHFTYNYETQVIQFGDGEFGTLPATTDSIFAWYTMCLDVLDYGTTGTSTGQFIQPGGVTAKYNVSHAWYDVYVADTGNDRIVKLKYIEPTDEQAGVMEWVTSWSSAYTGSTLSGPTGIDVHDNGTAGSGDTVYLFVCDTGNDRVVVYRDNDAEYEGDGGNTQPTFSMAFGATGTDFGEFANPEGIDVIYNNAAYEITVADAGRNFVVKWQVGDTPAIDVDYSNISSYGYLPTSSYTFNYNTANDYMAQNFPTGAYIQILYSDTTTTGQLSPILCSNTQYPATSTSIVWDIASTPGGVPADGVYYLYAKLYDANGIELASDNSSANTTIFKIDSSLLDGIGAFDDVDGDAYFYVQNSAVRQFTLDVIYPDSVAAVSWSGTFPAEYVQITDVDMGTAFETIQNQGIIFEFDYDNTAGTWEVQSAVLGSNTGLVSGATIYTVAVITVTVNSDAISPSSRFLIDTFDVTSGTWADYNGIALTTPTLRDLSLRIGYLGDIADPNAARGTAPNMIPTPDGIFGIDDIVVFSQAWNALANTWDPIGDLAPYSGTVPNIYSMPDGVLDVKDLMAFTTMFDWYQAQSFARAAQGMPEVDGNVPANIDVVQNRIGDKLIVEVYANDVEDLMTTEMEIYFDTENLSLENYRDGEFLSGSEGSFFRAYEGGNSLHIYNSRLNAEEPCVDGSGKLAVLEFAVTGDVEDIVVSFDMRDVNGEVIEKGSFSTLDMGEGQATLPTEFSLKQNFPNPFNPTTRIDFSIPEATNVKLTVYNVLGELVAELVNGQMEAGIHSVTWNAVDAMRGQHQASGIYFYTLKAGNNTATRKMLLFK